MKKELLKINNDGLGESDAKEFEKDLNEVLNLASKALEQQPSDDCVSRTQALKELKESAEHHANDSREEVLLRRDRDIIRALPPVTPTRKVGKWIYNNSIQNWECSECGETPKTMGYVGTAAFMTEHFKFCNHCGAEMRGVEK